MPHLARDLCLCIGEDHALSHFELPRRKSEVMCQVLFPHIWATYHFLVPRMLYLIIPQFDIVIVKLNLYLLVLLPARPPPDFSPTFRLVKESTLFFFSFLILGKHPPFRSILEADFVAESTNQPNLAPSKPYIFSATCLQSDVFSKFNQDFSLTLPKCSSSSLRS